MADKDDDAKRDIFGELIPTDTSGSHSLADYANEFAAGLGNVQSSITTAGVGQGLPFLGLSRSGQFHYGQEGIKVDPKSTAAIDIRSVQHGYSCWNDGQLLGEKMFFANETLPPVNSMPETGFPWAMAVSFELVFLPGTSDAGTKVLYKNSSLGGRKAVLDLLEKVRRQIKADPTKPIPIVRLDKDSYPHKKYGEIFYPIFELIGFTDGRSPPSTPKEPAPKPAPETAKAPEAGRRKRVLA